MTIEEAPMTTDQSGSTPSHNPIIANTWLALGLSALSGALIGLSMPQYGLGFLAWVGLVPLFLIMEGRHIKIRDKLAYPFGLVWGIMTHSWFPEIMTPWLGYLLMIGVGFFYGLLISLARNLAQRSGPFPGLLILATAWTAVEWLRYAAPITGEWWFALLANSQWMCPPSLQIASLTGWPGVSFLLILANGSLAMLIVRLIRKSGSVWGFITGLVIVGLVVGWGALALMPPPEKGFKIAATVDVVNHDPDIQSKGEFEQSESGYLANTLEMSRAIFQINAELTRETASRTPAFVVWPENEFTDPDDPAVMDSVKALAREMNAYIVADVVWRSSGKMFDTAIMIDPKGEEAGRRAKVHLTGGEAGVGFSAGPRTFEVFDTPHGKVGLGVCFDYHFSDIVRGLARNGADLMLMPTDDDFNGSMMFPPLHASDLVLRAVEHRVAFANGSVTGMALVVDPFGRITARSGMNKRAVVVGETFTVSERTIYTAYGDWFGWLLTLITAGLILWALVGYLKKKK
jgi:apolipoprotein N-acyltransferase